MPFLQILLSLFLRGCAIYQNFKEFSKHFSYAGSIEKRWSKIDFQEFLISLENYLGFSISWQISDKVFSFKKSHQETGGTDFNNIFYFTQNVQSSSRCNQYQNYGCDILHLFCIKSSKSSLYFTPKTHCKVDQPYLTQKAQEGQRLPYWTAPGKVALSYSQGLHYYSHSTSHHLKLSSLFILYVLTICLPFYELHKRRVCIQFTAVYLVISAK